MLSGTRRTVIVILVHSYSAWADDVCMYVCILLSDYTGIILVIYTMTKCFKKS